MIETIKAAVEKLNEVRHRGFGKWAQNAAMNGQVVTNENQWLDYAPYDAIRIARSYELEEEAHDNDWHYKYGHQQAKQHWQPRAEEAEKRVIELEEELARVRFALDTSIQVHDECDRYHSDEIKDWRVLYADLAAEKQNREEELGKWRADAEEILKNKLAVRVREGGGPEDLRASLAVTVSKIDGVRAMRELDLIEARQQIEGLEVELKIQCNALHLDKPEDRLWHDSDKTWWARDWSQGGKLVSAGAPREIRGMEGRLDAWYRVHTVCKELGMKTGVAQTGLGDVLNFIRGLAK